MLRLSLAPTLLADLVTGLSLTDAGSALEWWRLLRLLPVSLLLFAGGMALNARVDLVQDREQRPDRPLPSGQVPPGAATLLAAVGLLGSPLVGFACTRSLWLAAGAALLATGILAYHSPLRRHALLGPMLLGCIRAGDVLLPLAWLHGLSTALLLNPGPWLYGAFVTGASLVAHQEDRSSGRAWIPAGQVVAGGAALGALALVVRSATAQGTWIPTLVAAGLVAKEILPACLPWRSPRSPAQIEALAGRLLGRMPLLLVLVCLGAGQTGAAAVCLGCFLLVRILVRYLPPT